MNVDIKLDLNEIFDKAFTALAKAMNMAEEQLLPIMAKQMFIEGVLGLTIIGALLLVVIAFLVTGFFGLKKRNEVMILVGFIPAIIFSIAFLLTAFAENYLQTSVTKTFNPEYAVIIEVVDMAKGLLSKDDD